MLIFPTYQTLLAKAAATSSGGGSSFGGVTDNLVFHIDAGDTSSYSGSGTTVNSLVNSHTNDFYNSNVSYSSDDGGYWQFSNSSSDHTRSGIGFDYSSDFDFGSGDFTVEIWRKMNTGTEWGYSLFFGESSTPRSWTMWQFSGWWAFFRIYDSSNNNQNAISTDSGIDNNADARNVWHHTVVTKSDTGTYGQAKIYCNTSLRATHNYTSSSTVYSSSNSDNRLCIGGGTLSGSFDDDSSSTYPYPGKISIVRIYKGKCLTASEVSTNFDQEKSRYGYS